MSLWTLPAVVAGIRSRASISVLSTRRCSSLLTLIISSARSAVMLEATGPTPRVRESECAFDALRYAAANRSASHFGPRRARRARAIRAVASSATDLSHLLRGHQRTPCRGRGKRNVAEPLSGVDD